MTRAARGVARSYEALASRVRVWWIRARYPNAAIDRRTRIERGCRIICTDSSRLRLTGCHISAGSALVADNGGELVLERTFVGRGSVIVARESISIGAGCLFGEMVTMRDQDHRGDEFLTAPIRLGERVWLGAKVTVLRGTTIGADAVIGANAVVVRDVPSGARAVGVPATVRSERIPG